MPTRNEYLKSRQQRQDCPPEILYKYVDIDTAEKLLSNQTLCFKSPELYNDPYDSQWDITWELSTSEARQILTRTVYEAILNESSWPEDASLYARQKAQEWRNELQSNPEIDIHRFALSKIDSIMSKHSGIQKLKTYLGDIPSRMRVFCLSESDSVMLMWSHYAGQHTGVVLGFHVERLENRFRHLFRRVNYEKQYPRVFDLTKFFQMAIYGFHVDNFFRASGELLVSTKFEDWQYEREWRMGWIEDEAGKKLNIELFPSEALVEIVGGFKVNSFKFDQMIGLANKVNPNITTHIMECHESDFALVKKLSAT